MGAVDQRVQANAGDPFPQQAGVLPGREVTASLYPTRKEIRATVRWRLLEPGRHRLPGLLGELELNRAPRLLLDDRCSVQYLPAVRYIGHS